MLMVLCLALLAHPNSISSSLITPDPDSGGYHVQLRFEARTVHEFMALDTDGDGRLSEAELLQRSKQLGAYLLDHYQLRRGSGGIVEAARLESQVIRLVIDTASAATELDTTWLLAELDFAAAEAPGHKLWIDCDLFQSSSPDHRNFARFQGPKHTDWIFSSADPTWRLDVPGVPTTWLWICAGFEHILEGPDHLCFVIGLMLAAAGLRELCITITAFTLAHSVTLGMVAAGAIPGGGLWAELLIAISIIWVGSMNLLAGAPRRAWPEALGFGLLHGLAFAGAFGAATGRVGNGDLWPVIGFNLGIEAGQVCAGLLGALVYFAAKRSGFDEKNIRRVSAIGLVLAGCIWLGLRAFG